MVRMQWKSIAGRTYRVVQSTSFDDADWVPVSNDLTATGATMGWTNTVPAGAPVSFYRVRQVE